MSQKEELRIKFRNLRKEFHQRKSDASASTDISAGLTSSLCTELQKLRSENGIWISYRAIGNEADPNPAVEDLGGKWAYPRMQGQTLDFYLVNRNSSWSKGLAGIPEPDPEMSQQIDIHHAEGILVPALAFDQRGNRLGSGRAYYDRALVGYKGHKVGVAYSVQVSAEELPVEPTDIPMDFIVTEVGVTRVKGK